MRILNSLGEVVKEKFCDKDHLIEIKLFPGLKITSEYQPSGQSVSRRLQIASDYSIFLSAVFTDDFRKKLRKMHNISDTAERR